MNNRFWLGIFIGILVSTIGGVVFYYTKVSRTWQITFGEMATTLTGFFIAIYIPISIGQKIDNKKSMKTYCLEEIDKVEGYYKQIESIIEEYYRNAGDINTFKTLVQSKIKHISNKLLDIEKSGIAKDKIKELLNGNNRFREDITESFGDNTFSVDPTYIMLFIKCFAEVSLNISDTRINILNT